MTRKRVAIVVAIAVVLAGCSQGNDADNGPIEGAEDVVDLVPLGKLTGEEMCGLIDQSTIENEFDVTLTRPLGSVVNEVEKLSADCLYAEVDVDQDINDFFFLGTRVSVIEDAVSVEEALDEYFVESDGITPVDYERIDGLGDGARYAKNFRMNDNAIVVILVVSDTFFHVKLDVTPDGTPEQLRPVAVELVDGLEALLR